ACGQVPEAPRLRPRRQAPHSSPRCSAPSKQRAGKIVLDCVVLYDYTNSMVIRLREHRERRGLSVRQLAALAGVGFATVHRIEVGRLSPTVAMLEKLAGALDIHIADFFQPKGRRRAGR